MSSLKDLTGQTFGYLTVIARAPDHITPSGQKVRRWRCKCLFCGNETEVNGQHLKRGITKSCGCLQAIQGKQSRNRKTCVICGREFECPPSTKRVTCSDGCRRAYASVRTRGRVVTAETREKISRGNKGQDRSEQQKMAVKAAMESPNSGRFETNVNAIDWHLISPEGVHYYFHSLNYWLRENGERLFGCAPDSKEFKNVRSCLAGAKSAVMGKKYYPCCTYKGWRVIPTEDDEQ